MLMRETRFACNPAQRPGRQGLGPCPAGVKPVVTGLDPFDADFRAAPADGHAGDLLVGPDLRVGGLHRIESGLHQARMDAQHMVLEVRLKAGKGSSERLADEYALPGHRHAFPIRLDEGFALQVVDHPDERERKLLRKIARFDDRAITAGGPGLQPIQAAHLPRFQQRATRRSQMIGHRAGQVAVVLHMRDLTQAGEIEHYVPFVLDVIRLDDFGGNNAAQQGLGLLVFLARTLRFGSSVLTR